MAAHKDRLIQAADLLGMSPDALLTLLDARGPAYARPFADGLLGMARERQEAILAGNRVDPEDARTLARTFRELDIYLSGGGTPPEEWREGPDAPAGDEPIIDGQVYQFISGTPDIDESTDLPGRSRHDGQDVIVRGYSGAYRVEALDGATFLAGPDELRTGAVTPADRFADR